MTTSILNPPPEGVFVNVTDEGVTLPCVYWLGQWRDQPGEGSYRIFSGTATWDDLSEAPAPTPKVAKQDNAALAAADAALKQAEAAVEAAEATDASAP